MPYRSRERVAEILAHREADRVPYCAFADVKVVKMIDEMALDPDHDAFCREGDFAMVVIEPAPNREVFAPYLPELPEDAELSYWGIGRVAQTTAEGWHSGYKMYHPLAKVDTVAELRRYPFPDVVRSGADADLEARIQTLKDADYTVLGQMSQTILETAYNMRGMEQLMLDFYERPRYVDALFERIAEQRLFQARRFAKAGVDILRIGDDIAAQHNLVVSPKLYRERIKPFHASVIAAAHEVSPGLPVKYHSDGNFTNLLPDLIDIGVTIINPVQPECMDLAHIKREFGQHLTLWGCLPVQSTFAHGSREDVVRHLRFLMDEIAPGGGLVAKFTTFLATERSLANVRVFFETFYEMGRYVS